MLITAGRDRSTAGALRPTAGALRPAAQPATRSGRHEIAIAGFLASVTAIPAAAELVRLMNATRIAAYTATGCAVTAGGGVKRWGHSRQGELGDGTLVDRLTPNVFKSFGQWGLR